jgi:hypothetical protein
MPPSRKMTLWRNCHCQQEAREGPCQRQCRHCTTPSLVSQILQILQVLCQLHQGVQQTIIARHTGQPSSQTGTLPATIQHMVLKLNVDTPAPPTPTNEMGTTLQPPDPIPRAAARPTKIRLWTPDGLNQRTCQT